MIQFSPDFIPEISSGQVKSITRENVMKKSNLKKLIHCPVKWKPNRRVYSNKNILTKISLRLNFDMFFLLISYISYYAGKIIIVSTG